MFIVNSIWLFCFSLHYSATSCFLFVFSAKLVPVGYGIKKLVISCVVEDDKV